MKPIFFHAVANHPKVARALDGQAWRTLRPFDNYLRQAINTAKSRQVRYQLPWERVRHQISIDLKALDTRIRIPRRRPGVILTGWTGASGPDLQQDAFVTNRSQLVQVRRAVAMGAGLLVEVTTELQAGDQLIWCQQPLVVTLEDEAPPPQVMRHLNGEPLVLRGQPTADDTHWICVVDGKLDDRDIDVDGTRVTAEALPAFRDLTRVSDAEGRLLRPQGALLKVSEMPADGPLIGDNGVRFAWLRRGKNRRDGIWVQLLAPIKSDDSDFVDPRAAFCEGDVGEVWTDSRRSKETTYKVYRVDTDRYQLQLKRLPPEGSTLFLPINLNNLYLQRRALRQLKEAPLPHHQGLLRLCEDPRKTRWPLARAVQIAESEWTALTDETRDGTPEQRNFVQQALGTPDFAFLEGPPGSGKTTAICEIVQHLVQDGKKVLLCASTHVAIDNVLERLIAASSPIDAVRIGHVDKVDEAVQRTQLDTRVEALVGRWHKVPAMEGFTHAELEGMAERTVIMAANLTCGTTMGIVRHPLFQGQRGGGKVYEKPISTMPHWDVLIVDEASKTLIQEFMVPALMAKRWIVVGDVRQLPPFTERADIVANLRDLVDENDKPVFPSDHQRACLLIYRLGRQDVRQPGLRWLIVEPPGVLGWIERELAAAPIEGLSVVRVVKRKRSADGPVVVLSAANLEGGAPEALHAAAADWVLVEPDLIGDVGDLLPATLALAHEPQDDASAFACRQAAWIDGRRLGHTYGRRKRSISTVAQCQDHEADWLARNTLGEELAWRITRIHELRQSRNQRQRERLQEQLKYLLPRATDISEPIAEITDIGLPSILEVIQDGIGEERSQRPSALTQGFRAGQPKAFAARFESLTYQHRMHPQISAFSRDVIYRGGALIDANTIEQRDANIEWSFADLGGRRAWAHLIGREVGNENPDEVAVVRGLLCDFIAWAKRVGPPRRSAGVWQVACLSFYVKQMRALSTMLRTLTKDDRATRFEVGCVEIVCGTVDRFQGREADLVLVSMRNTRRIGFLDSPNRLNVALTRARQQVVVVGNAEYFGECHVDELRTLARTTPRVDDTQVKRWQRSAR